MKEFRADLHCHSSCSDGTNTPEELVRLALEIGLSGLSITDHDSIEAYKTALPLAKQLGLEILLGVEFSTVHQNQSIHILGYNYQIDHPAIVQLCARHQQRRRKRNQAILDKLREKGMPIEESEIQLGAEHTIGRPHIAQVLVNRGYAKDINDAFQKWLGDGKSCYARGENISTEETISVIHESGGIAVIAHPHLIKNRHIINALLELPFDGIECYYARFQPAMEQPWVDIATKKGLLITGGSDYHGDVKPETPLGASWVNEETFRKLFKHAAR